MRMTFTARYLVAPLLGAVLFASCSKSEPTPEVPVAATVLQSVSAPGFPEGFETGTKTAYTTGSVTLGSGSWTLNDALIGNTTSRPQSRRLVGPGAQQRLAEHELRPDRRRRRGDGGHAKYGTDANGTWELWASSQQRQQLRQSGQHHHHQQPPR